MVTDDCRCARAPTRRASGATRARTQRRARRRAILLTFGIGALFALLFARPDPAAAYGCAGNDLTITTSTTWSTDGCYGHVVVSNGATLTIAGNTVQELQSLTVGDGVTNGTVAINSDTGLGVGAEVRADNVLVHAASAISADVRGFAPGTGPASGGSYTGASHAGMGAGNNAATYGSITEPTTLGSGGSGYSGWQFYGGGAIKLSIANTITVDGTIGANGTGGACQGGGVNMAASAGGSVWIDFTEPGATWAGTGAIRADGGSAQCGGGGGGRIAITGYDTMTFSGITSAYGGTGSGTARNGASGTVYTQEHGTDGTLVIDNAGNPLDADRVTPLSGAFTADLVRIANRGNAGVQDSTSFTPTASEIHVAANGTLSNFGTLDATAVDELRVSGTFVTNHVATNGLPDLVTVHTGGVITHPANGAAADHRLDLDVTNLVVEAGGAISADVRGFAPGQGPAPGGGYTGASHAGMGANNNAATYGSITGPTTLGSGGSGYSGWQFSGGGAIKLSIAGSLTLDGAISANGTGGSCQWDGMGGSAGGSLWIVFADPGATWAGTGAIRANGGSSYCGAGGGGRVAITGYSAPTFAGAITASGGTGSGTTANGAAGTVYSQALGTDGTLVIDNAGNAVGGTTYTPLTGSYVFEEVIARNRATPAVRSGATFEVAGAELRVETSSSFLNEGVVDTALDWRVGSTATFDNRGALTVASAGFDVTIETGGTILNTGTFDVGATDLFSVGGTFSTTTANGASTVLPDAVHVTSTGWITHPVNGSSPVHSLDLAFVDLTIDTGGRIDVNGRGYPAQAGPGGGNTLTQQGGTHAGRGTENTKAAYGSVREPITHGSGGQLEPGGGVIRLHVTGTLTNNGAITANGQQTSCGSYGYGYQHGGGAGGSIWITFDPAATWTGAGQIRTDGSPNYNCRGGGGGRISVTGHTTIPAGHTITSRALNAGAGAGTIHTQPHGTTHGALAIDNDNITGAGQTPLATEHFTDIDTFVVSGRALTVVDAGTTVDVPGDTTVALGANSQLTNHGTLTGGSPTTLTVATGATLTNTAHLDLSGFSELGLVGTLITTTANGASTVLPDTVHVTSTGWITHPVNGSTPVHSLDLAFGDLTLDAGGRIDVNGRGYPGQTGPGGGTGGNERGGAHAGRGNGNTQDAYGSVREPITHGSGGWQEPGGGVIRLHVTGTLTNNGSITANGQQTSCGGYGNGYARGGGAGGSIWITFDPAATWIGTGQIRTDGSPNPSCSGGGGGGRISITGHTTIPAGHTITSRAPNAPNGAAGAGTIHTQPHGTPHGTLTIDNDNITNAGHTPLATEHFTDIDTFVVSGRALTVVDAGTTLDLPGNTTFTLGPNSQLTNHGTLTGGSPTILTVGSGATITNTAALDLAAFTELELTGTFITTTADGASTVLPDVVHVTATGWITHPANTATPTHSLDLAFGDLTIDTGGRIDVNGRGYPGQTGPGSGNTANQQGGTYAGRGAGNTKDAYGSITQPTTPGSGGWQEPGGGVIRIHVTGTLAHNGSITANGQQTSCGGYGNGYARGGGAGGSIWITFDAAATWTGTGQIRTDGSPNPGCSGTGGGGGRISITGHDTTIPVGHTITSRSPNGGGAGTIHTRTHTQTHGALIIDNDNLTGAGHTPLIGTIEMDGFAVSGRANVQVPPDATVTVGGEVHHAANTTTVVEGTYTSVGSSVDIAGTVTFVGVDPQSWGTVTVMSGGVVTHTPNGTAPDHALILHTQALTIAAGGVVHADGRGYVGGAVRANGSGDGGGSGVPSGSGGGGGGGHGGNGATGTGAGADGGNTYGTADDPVTLGSGGGGGAGSAGGSGGGRLHLVVDGTLDVAGRLSADGTNAAGANGGGGGSGGSINVRAGSLVCPAGIIRANGGNGGTGGGRGGGGRIAIRAASIGSCAALEATGHEPGTIVTFIDVKTPADFAATATGIAAIEWSWTDASTNETEFRLLDPDDAVVAVVAAVDTPGTGTTITETVSGLDVNTTYTMRVVAVAIISSIEHSSAPGAAVARATWAATPGAASTTATSVTSVTVELDLAANPAPTELAIRETGSDRYVQTAGTLDTTPVWRTPAAWGALGVSVTGLSADADYEFEVIARNHDAIVTAAGPAGAATTLATIPATPTLSDPDTTSLRVALGADGNPARTEYAIEVGSARYLQADGTVAPAPAWRTRADWGSPVTVTGLQPDVEHTVVVRARNAAQIETAGSTPVSLRTPAVVPEALTLVARTDTTLTIVLPADANPPSTAYTIRETTSGRWLQVDGTLAPDPAYHTRAEWAGPTLVVTGLRPNTAYALVAATSAGPGTPLTARTNAATPNRPIVVDVAPDTVVIVVDPLTNPPETAFAIRETTTGLYVHTDGALAPTPDWTTHAGWGAEAGQQLRGLSPGTRYEFTVIARDDTGDPTPPSHPGDATTRPAPPVDPPSPAPTPPAPVPAGDPRPATNPTPGTPAPRSTTPPPEAGPATPIVGDSLAASRAEPATEPPTAAADGSEPNSVELATSLPDPTRRPTPLDRMRDQPFVWLLGLLLVLALLASAHLWRTRKAR